MKKSRHFSQAYINLINIKKFVTLIKIFFKPFATLLLSQKAVNIEKNVKHIICTILESQKLVEIDLTHKAFWK